MSEQTLPEGWAWATLDEVANLSLGKMLDKKQQTGHHPTPYLRNINVRWFSFDLGDLAEMDIRPEELDRVTVHAGDLVVCEGGEPGRCAVWGSEPIAIQKALHRVRPHHGVEPKYLAYALSWWTGQEGFDRFVTGTTIKHVPQERLRILPVPLPPLNEQRRIVDELERRLSHVDAAEAGLRAVERKLEVARRSLLRAAVAGELSLDTAYADELRVDPAAWKYFTLADLARVGSGSTPKRGEPRYWKDGTVAWVTSGQVVAGSIAEPAELITDDALRETSVKLWPAGTLLMAMYGEGRTRGYCAELLIDATCNQACAAIDLKPEFQSSKRFVKLVLDARYEENRVLGSGGVQENLNLGLVKSIEIALPSDEEQEAILAEVDRRLSLVQSARSTVELGLRRCATLRRSLLAAAFSGKLVPQDPNDEPAAELLARIRSEREAAAPAKRTRKATTRKAKSKKEVPA